jgi:hypothetical protein
LVGSKIMNHREPADQSPGGNMAGASVSEMARDIVVALIQSGKIQLDANARKQGEWLGDLFKAVHQRIVLQGAIEVLVEDQLKHFDLEDLRQLRELLDAEIAARS